MHASAFLEQIGITNKYEISKMNLVKLALLYSAMSEKYNPEMAAFLLAREIKANLKMSQNGYIWWVRTEKSYCCDGFIFNNGQIQRLQRPVYANVARPSPKPGYTPLRFSFIKNPINSNGIPLVSIKFPTWSSDATTS